MSSLFSLTPCTALPRRPTALPLPSRKTTSMASSQNPKPSKSPLTSAKLIASCSLLSLSRRNPILDFGGGNGGGNGGRGGGGGGLGGGDDFLSKFFYKIFCPVADDDPQQQEWDSHGLPAANIVVQVNNLSLFKKYKVSDVIFFDVTSCSTVDSEDPILEMVSLRPGGIYTRELLQKELETLSSCGYFSKVDLEAKSNPDGTIQIKIRFVQSTWQRARVFSCIDVGLMQQTKPIERDPDLTFKERLEMFRAQAKLIRERINESRPCLLPAPVAEEILDLVQGRVDLTTRVLLQIREMVQKWYHENGYSCAQVIRFQNLNTEELVCEVFEGDITRVDIQFRDKMGNVCEGKTQVPVIERELPNALRPGNSWNGYAREQFITKLDSLSLFSNIEVDPHPDEKNEGGITVEIKLKELEDLSTSFSGAGGIGLGAQDLTRIGGSCTLLRRNIEGLNRSLIGSVTVNNFLTLESDWMIQYLHPYVDGVYSPRNRNVDGICFKTQNRSPVFTGGPGIEVPPIWVDRVGVKANITENFSRQSKFTYGLVMEEITTRDHNGHITASGPRLLPGGGVEGADGPPTTLSGTGVDRMAFLQANITRDNTKFLNGAIVGERNVFQVDQGLGIRFPFFNRHQLTVTRFLQLKNVEEGAGKPPPPVLVLHGHYGGCVGELPNYDAFTLGGPNSVRGYRMGELGAARNVIELAAELRIPVRNAQAYFFIEHGNDLGCSGAVRGHPNQVYIKTGQGSSYGVGMKIGVVRVEYAVGQNSSVCFEFGERF